MDENDVMVRERLTAVESSCKSLHKRVDHIEELVESVQRIAIEVQHMREDLNSVSRTVDELEAKPAKRWDLLITALISAAVSGGFSIWLSHFIGG